MKNINVPGLEQLDKEAQSMLAEVSKRLGKVPNLYATVGYSSPALKGLLDFEANLNKGVFSPQEREAIALIVSQVNKCAYCLAAHTLLAKMKGFSKEETLLIRKGIAKDFKLNATIRLAKSIAENKGNPDSQLLEAFFTAGYNEAALIELIGLITLRTFTNYVYAATNIPIDFPAADAVD